LRRIKLGILILATSASASAKLSEEVSAMAPLAAAQSLTLPQKNASRAAQTYLKSSAISREGLIRQLASRTEGYEYSDACVAVDSLHINWKLQAEKSAKLYLKHYEFSCQGLIHQLSSDAEKFKSEEATYGANAAGACQ
jgi:hypothetical protein